MNRPKHNRWLLTLFLVCAIILSLPLPKANAQNFVNNRFNVVVVLDASGSMKNTDPNGLRYEAISQFFGLLAEQGNALGGVVFHTELAAEETLTEITDQSGKDTVMDSGLCLDSSYCGIRNLISVDLWAALRPGTN